MVNIETKDIQFNLGTPLDIERRREKQRIRGPSRVIGVYEPRFLIVDLPYCMGNPLFSTTSEKCIVRFLHEGTMLGFWAKIVKITFDPYPFPMMILELPDEVEEQSLRKHARLGCNLPVLVTPIVTEEETEAAKAASGKESAAALSPPEEPLKATIMDLAEGGCQVALSMVDPKKHSRSVPMAPDPTAHMVAYHVDILKTYCGQTREVFLDFELPQPAPGKYSNVKCAVRWARVTDRHFLLGLQFLKEDETFQEGIRAIIKYQDKYFSPRFAIS